MQFREQRGNPKGASMTLWILFCRMTEKWDTLFTFYARDCEDAEVKAEKILQEYPYERLDLKAYPGGFVMHKSRLAGVMEEERV